MRFVGFLIFPVLFFLVTACDQESSDLGKDFIGIHSTVSYIDSITVAASTVLLDSMQTSGQNVILCGNIKDKVSEFGTITSNSFFQLGIPGSLSITDGIYYDSITLNLKSNGFIYGDTTQYYSFSVHRLTEEIADNRTGIYYNTNSFAYDPKPLGTLNIKPRPLIKPRFEVRLSDEWGSALFKKIQEQDIKDSILDQTVFLKYFKGIALVSSNTNSLIMGFKAYDTTAYVRLYYHQKGATENTSLDLKLYNTAKQFNQVITDRTGSKLSALTYKNQELSSTKTDNQAYMQSSVGLAIKFSFPYIKSLSFFSKYYSILKADLIIKPVRRTYDNTHKLPTDMLLYKTDGSYALGTVIKASDGTNPNYGNLTTDFINPENTYYSYDITSYIINLMATQDIDNLGLLFFSPTLNSSLERLVIGDQYNYENKTYLRLYYVRYEE
jgi:hypothetical protein